MNKDDIAQKLNSIGRTIHEVEKDLDALCSDIEIVEETTDIDQSVWHKLVTEIGRLRRSRINLRLIGRRL